MTQFIGSRVLPECVYHRPTQLSEVLSMLQELKPAVLVAGCTDFIPAMRKGIWTYPDGIHIIDLKQVPELTQITLVDETITIGGAVRLNQIIDSEPIQDRLPLLAQAVQEMASLQVRNSATIGGNLCTASPAADTAPPLLAMNSGVSLLGSQGDEEIIPLSDFFTGPGQTVLGENRLLKAVHVPVLKKGERYFRKKMGLRKAFTISVISMALKARVSNNTFEDVSLAFGAVAPTPVKTGKAEDLLRGQVFSDDLVEQAASQAAGEVSPISDVRASAAYRREMARVLTRRGLNLVING